MTIHLVGFPHTYLDDERFSTCAFTTKAVRWIEMMDYLGQEIIAYWAGGRHQVGCEVVEVLSAEERESAFGDHIGPMADVRWNADEDYWQRLNGRAIVEIGLRIKPGDMVAIVAGDVQQSVVDAFSGTHLVIEPFVGYKGIAQNTFCAFESYAWMTNRYGAYFWEQARAFDAVIPNYFRPQDFRRGVDNDYALFLGRLTVLKGPHVAADIAERVGKQLLVAGPGAREWDYDTLHTTEGLTIKARYCGVADPRLRNELLAHASFLIVPTLYIEPFGSVHVEAMMSGVPVLTSDWGVFPDTVVTGIDGYRFRTPAQAAAQVPHLRDLRGEALRQRTISRFSVEAVAPAFDEWFWRLSTLRDGSDGWNAPTYLGTTKTWEPSTSQ